MGNYGLAFQAEMPNFLVYLEILPGDIVVAILLAYLVRDLRRSRRGGVVRG
jgi:hypothetical protein